MIRVEFKGDLAEGFAGKFYFEDALNFPDQDGAVIRAPFGKQLRPAPGDVVVDGGRALLIDATAQQDAREMLGVAREDGQAP